MKKLLSFVLAVVICFAFVSCGGAGYKKYSVASAAAKVSVGYKDAQKEDYEAFLDKLDSFASRLSEKVYSDSDRTKNLCISPVSVYMALALATECASGETREEILNAVGVTYDEVKSFTKVLYAFSNREFTYTNMLGNDKIAAFEELANSIWMDNDITLKDSGVNNLANNFNCDLFSVDFGNNQGEKAINAYIKDKTHGVIDGDIELSPETLITLINTFYLKDVWNDYGNDLKFTDDTYEFMNTSGNTTATKLLMGYYINGDIYRGEGYTSFLAETDHNFKIKFIVPDSDHTLDQVFTAENIYTINNITDYGYIDEENKLLHHTRALFPDYKASFDEDISDILKEDFGINKLFDFEECDFSNVTDEEIACYGVIHKCSLEVNKKGIEGAAVTAMPSAGAAGPLEGYVKVYHDFIVDRAFGFVITDSYGTVLFSGVINEIK